MAKRKHNNRRHRRRGGSGFLYKLLSVLVICAAVVAALTLFFRVDEIVVTGNVRYTADQIREITGVEIGDNLFLLNRSQVAKNIGDQLPYVEQTRVNPKAPDTLFIEVREVETPLAVVQDGSAWLINPGGDPVGKIVDQLKAEEAEGFGVIDGVTLLAPSVGTRMSLATEFTAQQAGLQSLMSALVEQGMIDRVDAIHLGDLSTLVLTYDGRFDVLLPYDADFSLKMQGLKAILESDRIQDNMTGTFDMRRDDGKVNLLPGHHAVLPEPQTEAPAEGESPEGTDPETPAETPPEAGAEAAPAPEKPAES